MSGTAKQMIKVKDHRQRKKRVSRCDDINAEFTAHLPSVNENNCISSSFMSVKELIDSQAWVEIQRYSRAVDIITNIEANKSSVIQLLAIF